MSEYRSTKDIAAEVRLRLKAELPGWKFSVTVQSFSMGSSITLALMEGPEQVMVGGDGYAQLNQFTFLLDGWLRQRGYNNGVELTPDGWVVMDKATRMLNDYRKDSSDAQIDYFCCNFYMHVQIGQWNKPYRVKG